MKIVRSRIRNVERYLAGLSEDLSVRVLVSVGEPELRVARRIGFDASVSGETVLPRVVGPATRFNAEGRYVVRRDLPKENRYVRTVLWRWQEWAGRERVEREETKDIYRDCYPREFHAPPSLELTFAVHGDERFITSEEFRRDGLDSDRLRHAVNVFLELFGHCELVAADLSGRGDPTLQRVNWRMLPPGEQPWPRLRAHLEHVLAAAPKDTRTMILERQENVIGLGPAQIFVGNGGFDDYLAYVFPRRGLVVLESIRRDNAIYVFGSDWEIVSQLSKAQVLSGAVHKVRIIHSGGWKERLANFIGVRRAA
jgi:hypothetical protein